MMLAHAAADGERTACQFALQYGFVPDHNRHDMLTVSVGDSRRLLHVGWNCAAASTPVEVRDACAELLRSMPTSLAEDVDMLRALEARDVEAALAEESSLVGKLLEERAIALRYRISKKQLLAAVSGLPASCAATSAFAVVA